VVFASAVAVLALVASAALSATTPSWLRAATEPTIETGAPVGQSQCAPCHLDLGNVSVPGLIFGHGNHLLVSCDACHPRMPHQGGNKTERVPMEVCFACHGIDHAGQGELATAECDACHTPAFTLRPKNHVATWAKKPHADTANRSGVNRCMMCHEAPDDCDVCHAREAPGLPKMPTAFHSIITPRPKGPNVSIRPRGPVSMSQCIYCHRDIDDILPGRLIFAHATHIVRNYRCEACHERFAHTELGVVRPDMMSCYRCHGLNHNSRGQVATEECDACHPKEFDLRPADHTRRFVKGDHAERADADPAYCAMCHASGFCVGCHRGEKVSPNAPGKAVIPADHRTNTWMREHGPIFLDGAGACGSCHDDPSCRRCHKTVMPHPVGWIEDHSPEPGVTRDDCNVCHTNRNKCQACHHDTVKRAELTRANCVPCHDEMKQVPATSIKHKSFAEHAVHFGVAEVKNRPYRCDDCHIGFGTAHAGQDQEGGLPQATHELRLCYGCHGSLDYQNRLIAPWRGRELCIRCHTDLYL
jgi:hypothetical protein